MNSAWSYARPQVLRHLSRNSVWAPASTRTKSTGSVFMKMPPSALLADCGLDHNVEFTDERIDYLGL